ncbi:MAG: 5'/3'-nucleotidase SurE [Sphingomonadales bacterium]
MAKNILFAHNPLFERILVTNDDGISASGLKILSEIANSLSNDVWVVAPLTEQSGAGHSITLAEPMRIKNLGDKTYGVQGTPTDCVILAINNIMKDQKPTLVLSGVNRGFNMADDITYSGTVAAAMEGTISGIPSIALSQALTKGQKTVTWEIPKKRAADLLLKLVNQGWPEGVFLNINFPPVKVDELKGVKVTRQGCRNLANLGIEERHDMRGYPYYWFKGGREAGIPEEDTDMKAIFEGWISVTPLHLELTHFETKSALENKINQID